MKILIEDNGEVYYDKEFKDVVLFVLNYLLRIKAIDFVNKGVSMEFYNSSDRITYSVPMNIWNNLRF